ncbi:hypothetical protein ACLESO_09250 [Pyxidicoccus sp. 3LG]
MQAETLEVWKPSRWNGRPFFKGYPEEGRHVYVVKSRRRGRFTAYGVLDEEGRVLFEVRGPLARYDDFEARVEAEGALVTFGLPPFETNTAGDKAPTTSRPGIRKPRPVKK